MGYAPFVNMDRRFFDVRGLTDAGVARAPSALKDHTGVHDRRWFLPDSYVGSRILRQSPALIYIVFDQTDSPLILGGRYKKTLISPDMQAQIRACNTAVNFYLPVSVSARP